jgi:signal transduction histidine kinase
MKLFTQYNRITLSVLVGFFLVCSLIYYFLMRGLLIQESDKSLIKIEKNIRNFVAVHNSLPVVEPLDDLRISCVKIASPTTGAPAEERSFLLIPPTPGKNRDNIRQMTFFLQLDHDWYGVTISRTLEGMKATALMVLKTAVVTLLIIAIAFMIVSQLLFRRLWQPFYDSIGVISRFKLGKNTLEAFPETSIQEFRFMNEQFIRMAAQISKEYGVLKQFTENASHEMQTPLAVIRSKLDLAIQDEALSASQSATLKSAYGSVKKLTSLNRALLLMARISNNQYGGRVVFNIKDKLQDKINQFTALWQDKLSLSRELHDAEIDINPDLADILLNNLFSNACKHNVPDGTVNVCLADSRLQIENTGRPVPLDESRMFQRFYKASKHEESNGLGLAILKEICDQSGITPSYSFRGNIHTFTLEWNRPARNLS